MGFEVRKLTLFYPKTQKNVAGNMNAAKICESPVICYLWRLYTNVPDWTCSGRSINLCHREYT